MRQWGSILAVMLCGCGVAPRLTPVDEAGMSTDAGIPTDAGADDAGVDAGSPFETDAGVDAGLPDVSTPLLPCTDAVADIYLTPTLAPMTMAARGENVRCAVHERVSQAEVQARIEKAVSFTAGNAVDIYRLSYRTYRRGGVPAISSARVYLPQTPHASPRPLLAFGHPSVGVADACAPSKEARGNEDTALPFAAKGYAVIVPDFAGLGTEGTQGYLDNVDSAQSLLDGTRALQAFVAPGSFDGRVVLVGYSQGGGVALAAQGLEQTYGASGRIETVAVLAPQWPSRLNSFRSLDIARSPDALTISFSYTNPVIAVLRQYAWGGAATLPASKRAGLTSALESMCLVPLGAAVHANYFARDLIDDSLRASLVACADDVNGAGCVEPGKGYHRYLLDNLVPPDPNGAPVLYLQGLLDTIMPVGNEAACNLPVLRGAGVDVTYCQDDGASHANLPERQADFLVKWVEARLNGGTLPTCATPTLPACPP